MREGYADWEGLGIKMHRPYLLLMLAESCGKERRVEEGLDDIENAIQISQDLGERYIESELYRVKGHLLLFRGNADGVEDLFRRAVDTAKQQGAKSLELRAATSLAGLLRDRGRAVEARELLSEIYGWFTEGFDTADLIDAKALLDELREMRRNPQ